MMKSFLVRGVSALLMILAVIVLCFLLIHLAPGDAADVIAGASGGLSEAQIAQLRATYGLDRPVLIQLLRYIGNIATGNIGRSYVLNTPVLDLILPALGATCLLAFSGLILGFTIGTALGIYSAWKRSGLSKHLVSILALIGFSAPAFWTGMMLILIFSLHWPIFPTSGMTSTMAGDTLIDKIADVIRHLALPAITLGYVYVAVYSRTGRASMLEIIESDYVRTAWAKGLSLRSVLFKHTLRNALLPLVTLAGLQMGALISSTVLIEIVFDWPGIARLLLDAVMERDVPVALGILLLSSIIVIVANLLTDALYGIIDPRIDMNKEES